MKSLRYVGPSATGLDVFLPDGRWIAVEHGGVLETSDEHAASLLEQEGCWEPVAEKAAAKAAREA